ncbi:hypothetical protein HZA87_01405, partial [Candidatus Uhrbacteria bacterium]|nr:hypothetical protein [Candidatus Uhrbacteria bacterium]
MSQNKIELFNGQTPGELLQTLGIPKDFHVTHMLGVAIEDVPRRYLTVFLEGAIFEARSIRKRLEEAFELGDKLEKDAGLKEEIIQKN